MASAADRLRNDLLISMVLNGDKRRSDNMPTELNPKATLEERVALLERSYLELRKDMDLNTQMTASVKTDTLTLVEFVSAMKGFATFCRFVGRILRFMGIYVAPIATAALAAWALLKGQKTPTP